ncbi:MAG: hypothetical protein AUK44_04510 [Porphyromonadaceae bacterium CG2_30_38_12]|nr:MAG: hypothetical protein AUK44_04510 [Porphyromonadaceae bacterium CG2_30_38_12]
MKIRYKIAILFFCFSVVGFSQNKAWFTNSGEAKTYAVENKVPIMLIFAGSDWCKPCMMFKHDILLNDIFQKYLLTHFALLYLDFPMQAKNKLTPEQKTQNELLADKYNKSGFFPNIVIINPNGKVTGQLNFKQQTTEVFIEQCNALLSKIEK